VPDRTQVLGPMVLGASASIVAVGVIALLRYVLGEPLQPYEWILTLVVLALLALLLLWLGYSKVARSFIMPRLRAEVRETMEVELREILRAELYRELAGQTGIIKVFPHFRACEKEIVNELKASSEVRIFLQIGRTVLAGNANFYEQLAEAVRPETRVRILHADPHSPYLSERTAHERGSRYNVWLADLDHAVKKVETLAGSGKARIEGRQHKEGYVWRLFIFDDFAYAQPYLYSRDNSERAPVLKISRWKQVDGGKEENENSLYKAFCSYFDFKWEEYLPEVRQLENIIPAEDGCVVAAVIRYHQFYIFAVPKRYISRSGREVPFHGVGGKRKPGEGWTEALEREISEEIGISVSVGAASRTRYLTTGAELEAISLSDAPRPYCIYKRTRDADPNFAHSEVLWIVGFEAEAKINSLDQLKPGSEVGALVILTGEMLRRTLHDPVTYESLSKAADGSRVILGGEVSLEPSRRAVPAGLATIVAAGELPRLARRL